MTWATSPAATELEAVILRWLRVLLKLPDDFFGVVYDTASVATLHALAAARESLQFNIRALGLSGRNDVPRLRIYASDQAHSSIVKAAVTLGIGETNVVHIACDDFFRMRVDRLVEAVEDDRAAGYLPLAVVYRRYHLRSCGGSGSGYSKVLWCAENLAARRRGVRWGHGFAARNRHLMEGVSSADSVVVNPHKWFFVPLDFSALYTTHPELLRKVFSLVPEYLRGDAEQGEVNYMDYGIQLGRRFRALKAWMVFSAFGESGLVGRIREHIRLAKLFASWITRDSDFELLAPVDMGVVCFRAVDADTQLEDYEKTNSLNRSIVKAINASGRAYLTHTVLGEKVAMRIAAGNVLTTEKHLAEVFEFDQSRAIESTEN